MKSPIKKKLLHNPEESLDNKMEDITYDIFLYYTPAIIVVILALVEWWKFYAKTPPTPIMYSVIAFIMVCISSWKIYKNFSLLKKIKLGRDGEKAVGQYLEHLRENGARIFHLSHLY